MSTNRNLFARHSAGVFCGCDKALRRVLGNVLRRNFWLRTGARRSRRHCMRGPSES